MPNKPEVEVQLPNREIKSIIGNPEKSAQAVDLIYVHDSDKGIKRIKKGKHFIYVTQETKVEDKVVLNRIKCLVIPPAWENVWICILENGHLQATGIDFKKENNINIMLYGTPFAIIPNIII